MPDNIFRYFRYLTTDTYIFQEKLYAKEKFLPSLLKTKIIINKIVFIYLHKITRKLIQISRNIIIFLTKFKNIGI